MNSFSQKTVLWLLTEIKKHQTVFICEAVLLSHHLCIFLIFLTTALIILDIYQLLFSIF